MPRDGYGRGNIYLQNVMHMYMTMYDIKPLSAYYMVPDEGLLRSLADYYELMPPYDASPETFCAYTQLAIELDRQFQFVNDHIAIYPWEEVGSPYGSSQEMFEDIQKNRRLFVFMGGEPHLFFDPLCGEHFTINARLRALHDLFGHAAYGNQWGMLGEENAWFVHAQMFSDLASHALATEIRAQSAWFNYGPYAQVPRPERIYPQQKIGLVPAEFADWRCFAS